MQKTIISLSLALLFGLVSSCDRGFEELNKNPNIPSTVDPDALFANAVYRYHTNYEHGVLTEIWSLEIWNQSMASIVGITAGSEYFLGGDANNNSWRIMYADVLGNTAEAIRLVKDDPEQANREAVYRIFRAYVFQRITDLWGDVPYDEAHQAIGTDEPNFTPAYQSQESIYRDLIAELKASAALLNERAPGISTQDWYFQGDIDRWRRFANTLRLRMALRLSEVDPAYAQQEVAAIGSAPLISEPEEDVQFPHGDFGRSPFYQLDFTGQGLRNPSKYLVDMLKSDNDPRLPIFAEPTPFSLIVLGQPDYEGVPSFLLSSEINPDDLNDFTTSKVGEYFLDINLPKPTMDLAESCLLQAEAIQRGWLPGDAMTCYNRGVRAHMEKLCVPDTVIIDYLIYDQPYDATLERIITEKWKTFVYTNPIEAYNEYRRTGFPVLLNRDGNPIDDSNFPKRLAYPDIEISFNGKQVDALGIDPRNVQIPVWWDVP